MGLVGRFCVHCTNGLTTETAVFPAASAPTPTASTTVTALTTDDYNFCVLLLLMTAILIIPAPTSATTTITSSHFVTSQNTPGDPPTNTFSVQHVSIATDFHVTNRLGWSLASPSRCDRRISARRPDNHSSRPPSPCTLFTHTHSPYGWKALLLCWLLLPVQPSFQGLVGRRRTTPSFEITDITSTCIYFKWGDPPYEAALKHFILQGTAVDSNKTVEIRFAATEREGFLCNLEPSTYYATSLISVTGVHVPPVKVDLKKVSTRSADSSSRGPTAVLNTPVSNLTEEVAMDSNSKLNNHNFTKTPETKTVKSTPQSQEDASPSPTRPSELDGQGIVKEGAFLKAATAIIGFAVASLLAYYGIPYITSFSVFDVGEPSLNRMSSGAPEPISSHNDSVHTLTKSEYIETKMVELQTQANIGTLQEEGLPPAAIIVTVFGILSLLVLVIGVSILLIRRRRRMKVLKLNIAMVDRDDVDSKISSDF
ncbi:hypothetical protein SprV_0802538800 [Sparganum proliferum]